MIQVGIIGGSGYVAGELIRCLVHHPKVKICFLYSHSMPDAKAVGTHQDLIDYPDLEFTNQLNPDVC